MMTPGNLPSWFGDIAAEPKPPHNFGVPVKFENIPREIQGGLWCVWQAKPRKGQLGKFDKIPSNGQFNISTNEPEQWLSYEEARDLYLADPDRFNGVGKLVLLEDEFTYLDFDNVDPEAKAAELQTYSELSPSGKGVRAIAAGTAPRDITKPEEIYSGHAPRFVTITGHRLNGHRTVEAIPDFIDHIIQQAPKPADRPLKEAVPEILQDVTMPSDIECLSAVPEGVDRSAELFSVTLKALRAGLSAQKVFSWLVTTEWMGVAEDHRGGKRNPAIEYLWNTVQKADVQVKSDKADMSAGFGSIDFRNDAAMPQFGSINAAMQPISARELFKLEFGELVWNIQDLLPAGTMLLFGKPKKGKSFLTLMMAISVAARRPVFGKESSGCTVLYLGLEDSERRAQRRLKGCARSLGIDPAEFVDKLFLSTTAKRIDTGLIEELRAWMATHPDTGMVVVDMLKKVTGKATGKDLYAEQAVVGDSLTKFSHEFPELSIIVVHHSRKTESDDPFDLVSGTTGLSGSYDSLAVITDVTGSRTLHMTGRDLEGAEISLLMNERGMYTLEMPDPAEARAASMSDTRRAVFDAVPDNEACKRAKIVFDCGLDGNTVDQQLFKLVKSGLVKKAGWGQYQRTGTRFFDEPIVEIPDITN